MKEDKSKQEPTYDGDNFDVSVDVAAKELGEAGLGAHHQPLLSVVQREGFLIIHPFKLKICLIHLRNFFLNLSFCNAQMNISYL